MPKKYALPFFTAEAVFLIHIAQKRLDLIIEIKGLGDLRDLINLLDYENGTTFLLLFCLFAILCAQVKNPKSNALWLANFIGLAALFSTRWSPFTCFLWILTILLSFLYRWELELKPDFRGWQIWGWPLLVIVAGCMVDVGLERVQWWQY